MVLVAGVEDTAYTVSAANLLLGFSDVDGDSLTVSGFTANHASKVVSNANGTFTITPAANYNGVVNLTYNVIDGHGGSVAATQSFSLTPVRDDLNLIGTSGKDNLRGDQIDANSYDRLSGLAGDDKLSGVGGDDTLLGSTGNDTLTGGNGADLLIGGKGKDSYALTESGAATDTVQIATGDSLVSGFDVVTGFKLATSNATSNSDKLDLMSTKIAANNAVNGTDAGTIRSHAVVGGLISFDDVDVYAAPLVINGSTMPNVMKYLQSNIAAGDTVVFNHSNGNAFVFQGGTINDTVVQLTGVTASGLSNAGLTDGAVWLV